MSLFPVSIQKERALLERMRRLRILEEDLDERFVRSSGAGGQKVNKTATCVVLIHRPSGEIVKCQKARTQGLNRFLARRILLEKIGRKIQGKKSAERQRVEKIRRQKRRRSRRAREKILADKQHQAKKKTLRAPMRTFRSDD